MYSLGVGRNNIATPKYRTDRMLTARTIVITNERKASILFCKSEPTRASYVAEA